MRGIGASDFRTYDSILPNAISIPKCVLVCDLARCNINVSWTLYEGLNLSI